MQVLVIGGAGYIGSHCVRILRETGHQPVILDNLSCGHREAVAQDLPFYQGDLGDEPLVEEILRRHSIEVVMHFAAYALVGESVTDPLKYYRNNLSQPIGLLAAMLRCGVRRFVFSSTCATYGIPAALPITEDLPQAPINPYGQTKLDFERALSSCAAAYGLGFAAFRYFNAAGAAEDGSIGEDHQPETHLIPLAIRAAQGLGPELRIFGTDYPTPDGTCLRDYVHVDDLSRAHIAVFPKLAVPGTSLFYNLGTGTPASVRQILETVEAVTGLRVPSSEAERRPGDPPALFADPSKAVRELGWDLRYRELRSIIESAWKWHSARPRGYAG